VKTYFGPNFLILNNLEKTTRVPTDMRVGFNIGFNGVGARGVARRNGINARGSNPELQTTTLDKVAMHHSSSILDECL